jgi:Arc/MetJ-type ribon-helix-helix transcriptional regulator
MKNYRGSGSSLGTIFNRGTYSLVHHDQTVVTGPHPCCQYDDVMRKIVDLPEEQLTALDAWRSVRGVSRAEAIRRAVASLLASDEARHEALTATQGLWASRDEDGLAYQERLRGEWDGR